MPWDKPSPTLMALLEDALTGIACEKRKMFGCPAYFVNGNMFAGVHEDHLMMRLGEADRQHFFAAYGEEVAFEPMGRRMKEYIVLPEPVRADSEQLVQWLQRAHAYAATVPLKAKPAKRQ